MNIIKKYWDSVYIYVLLLIFGFCICAGIFWTVCKMLGLYPDLQWNRILLFDCSQLIYMAIALYIIYRNKKDVSYISEHLRCVKGFIVLALFVQYNFILYLFPSIHVWECTFLFLVAIVFLFDSKLMLFNCIAYFGFWLVAHILKPEQFLPLEEQSVEEVIAYRVIIYVLTATCVVVIVYFVERFLMQEKESREENIALMQKQLQYYKDMELLDQEIRKFRHDIRNHFICMESLFRSGNTEELQQYFQDLEKSVSVQKKIYFSGNEIIDAILHHDLSYHCNERVGVTIYGSLPEIDTISAMDLCTIFSNLLSNAISSANQCATVMESQIIVCFAGGRSFFSIEVSNSVLSNHIIKGKNNRNHGFGVKKIREVLDKYGGNYEIDMEQHNMFTIKVYLPI